GGTGLGLAIARELTEAHGGRLAYVEQETGTRFDIVLPASALVQ
ncbi:MAG: cell wall metabolism sensor histidine kinase WalK, partial [Gammaproteobacteria bacterium]|nr:cell wall metabolism sensor histidine kinase WalK [Gammaproteobacteria bacterium]